MNSFKHQLLEVVASGVLFNISNPSVPPDAEELFLSMDKSWLLETLISCWLLFYFSWNVSSIKQLPTVNRITNLLPEKGWIMLFGYLFKLLIGQMDLESNLSPDVVQHVIITTIILQASCSLYHQDCYTQLGTILVMAAINTLLTITSVSLFLSLVYAPWVNPELTVFDCLTFSCIISAVGKYRNISRSKS